MLLSFLVVFFFRSRHLTPFSPLTSKNTCFCHPDLAWPTSHSGGGLPFAPVIPPFFTLHKHKTFDISKQTDFSFSIIKKKKKNLLIITAISVIGGAVVRRHVLCTTYIVVDGRPVWVLLCMQLFLLLGLQVVLGLLLFAHRPPLCMENKKNGCVSCTCST